MSDKVEKVSNSATRRLRAVDLARSAGLSVQQVRNYVDEGLLPPVERTPSGYRIFTAAHADALVVARQVIEGHGWQRARKIMAAIHRGDLEAALAVIDLGHAQLDVERTHIDTVLGAFEAIVTGPRPAGGRGLRIGEVARAVGVRTSALRLWEQRGLLRPEREKGTGYRRYDVGESRRAHIVALLRKGGYHLDIVRSVLDEMRSSSHSRKPERVRAELARRERELERRSWARLRASAAVFGYAERLELTLHPGHPTHDQDSDSE